MHGASILLPAAHGSTDKPRPAGPSDWVRLLLLALTVFWTPSEASAGEAMSSALGWLAAQSQPDHSYSTEGDIGTAFQSTAESLRAFHGSNAPFVPDPQNAISFLVQEPYRGTEYLSRLIRVLAENSRDTGELIPGLLERQNPDGGFGGQPGSPSTALDSSFALEALYLAGPRHSAPAGSAIAFLRDRQREDGSWGSPGNQPSVYVTALALRAMWHFRHDVDLEAELERAQTWLLASREGGTWGESYEAAVALIAVLPRLAQPAPLANSIRALEAAQAPDGSWNGDVFTTALVVRALALAARPAPNPDLGTLTGYVTDGDTGLPLSGVEASLARGGGNTSITGADGRFLFDALQPGDYRLTLALGGYERLIVSTGLADGDVRDLGTLALLRESRSTTGTVRGQVTESGSGRPLAGVRVSSDQGTTAITAADGIYQLSGLDPGELRLTATGEGYYDGVGGGTLITAGILVFSPALQAIEGTSPPPETGIVGQITDPGRVPLPGARVEVSGSTHTVVQTDGEGRYRISPIQPGSIDIRVSLPGYDPVDAGAVLFAQQVLQFSPVLYPATTTPVGANAAVVGGLVLDSGTNAPLAGVAVQVALNGVTEVLVTDPDGRFTVTGIKAPELELGFDLDGYRRSTLAMLVEPLADRDIGQVRLRREGAQALLPDLVIASVDVADRRTDPDSLRVGGSLAVSIANLGTAITETAFEVLAFQDTDGNGIYSHGSDPVLGHTPWRAGLAPDEQISLSLPVEGKLPFRDAPIGLWVDSTQAVAELEEGNNTSSTALACRILPEPLGAVEPVEKWRWTGIQDDPSLAKLVHVVSPALVGQLSDDNADGFIDGRDIPDLVFAAGNHPWSAGSSVLLALSGDDGRELWRRTDLQASHRGAGALGDIDGDGLLEVVVTNLNRSRLIALEHDGTTKWSVPAGPSSRNPSDGLVIVDLRGDGTPEIIQGRRVYDNGGNLLWTGQNDRADGGHSASLWGLLPIAADVDLDGTAEVIAGRTLYDADGITLWHRGTDGDLGAAIGHDGYNAVGNFDEDDFAEIVLVAGGRLYLLEHSGETIWGPVALPGGDNRGGPPTVGDFDNDGEPEIGVAGATRYAVFEGDGSVKWTNPIQDRSSAGTGSSLFDFDDDGEVEVLFADERHFRIYDGSSGAVLVEIPNNSTTATEYPVVADVDGDQAAEIVVSANWNGAFKGIRVFEPADGQWAGTRALWNQHSYHITNINDDGAIPRRADPSWLAHNTYRLNSFTERNPLGRADLSVGRLRLMDNGYGEPFSLGVQLGNGGEQGPLQPASVSFYQGPPDAGGVLLGSLEVTDLAAPGFQELRFDGVRLSGTQDLYALVDPDNLIDECAEHNNAATTPHDRTRALGKVSVTTDAQSYGPGNRVDLHAEVTNTGSFSSDYRLVLQIEDTDGELVAALAPRTLEALAAGSQVAIDERLNTEGVLAGNYLVRGVLLDGEGSPLGESRTAFALTGGDGPVAALRLATDRPVYHTSDDVAVEQLARNLSANRLLSGVRIELEVAAPDGRLLHATESQVDDLVPSGQRLIGVQLALQGATQGLHLVTARLLDGLGALLARAEAQFQVRESLMHTLTGTSSVSARVIEPGDTQICSESLTNEASQVVTDQPVRRLLVRMSGEVETPLSQEDELISLEAGMSRHWVHEIDPSDLAPGDYACVLQAEIDTEWRSLAYAAFQVVKPPIEIDARLDLGQGARLLALVGEEDDCRRDHSKRGHHDHRGGPHDRYIDSEGDGNDNRHGKYEGDDDGRSDHGRCTCPEPGRRRQRTILQDVLQEMGWSFTLVSKEDDFRRELRSGGYRLFLLSSARIKLDRQIQKELREAVFNGAGLVVAGARDARNDALERALGIRLRDKALPVQGLSLLESALSDARHEPLPLDTDARRVVLAGARAAGLFIDKRGMLTDRPAVTVFDYGDGRSLYFAFDLLTEAAREGPVADPFAGLLLGALDTATPSPPAVAPAAVVPLALRIQNRGIPVEGRALLTLPEGINLVDAGAALQEAPDSLAWSFNLEEQASTLFDTWLRLPDEESSVPLEVLIQIGQPPRLTDYRSVQLELTPQRPPGLGAALIATEAEDGFERPMKSLRKASKALDGGEIDKALRFLVKTTDQLLEIESPQTDLIRHWVDNAITEVARSESGQ